MTSVLLFNEHKTDPKQPDYEGEASLDGVAYRLSAWLNEEHGTANRSLSLTFAAKDKTKADDLPTDDSLSQLINDAVAKATEALRGRLQQCQLDAERRSRLAMQRANELEQKATPGEWRQITSMLQQPERAARRTSILNQIRRKQKREVKGDESSAEAAPGMLPNDPKSKIA